MLDCNTSGNTILSQNRNVFLFPGQGTQFVGMGKEVCDNNPKTKQIWDCACDISGTDIRKLCMAGPMIRLTKTIHQQIAVTTVNIAMYENMCEYNDISENAAFAGHSAGEYSALYAAGVFNLENLFKAIFARASIMQQIAESTEGMMFVVKDISYQQLYEFIQDADVDNNVKIANDNSPRQQVISGDSEIIKHFSIYLQQAGFPQIKLPVNGAWHSHLMSPAESALSDAFKNIQFNAPNRAIYMNMTAQPVNDLNEIKSNLIYHITNTVRWRETMENLHQHGYQNFIEISCKKVLSHLLANHEPLNQQITIFHLFDYMSKMNKQVA